MPAEVAVASHISLDSPLGPLTIRAAGGAVIALDWGRQTEAPGSEQALLAEAARQLAAYFAEGHFRFDLPLHPRGSVFQRAVWDFMLAIPAGETRTYGDCATALAAGGIVEAPAGSASAAQAVGGACGANPIPVIIPCHRILAAGGRTGGYSGRGGVVTKRWLLEHEGAWQPERQGDLFGSSATDRPAAVANR
ncbi:methylated-DNA--[protein]-cysteine S-methyltransferase [Ferrovibrio xuzhouensis]|uniref:Methylated-DNA--[protein]-cysteine S-methyltransferase n=1 Tax=Ferrovibrio xuzhouensis TaxID=1576914 RepID=A0ABV7VG65_9PROT